LVCARGSRSKRYLLRVLTEFVDTTEGQEPLAATAIHDGHDLRAEVGEIMALADSERLREEDPHTGIWTTVASTRLVARRSRFEVDLNRPRARAVYRSPEDAWGLAVWKREPPVDLVERSLQEYDAFYAEAHRVFSEMERRFGHFVVFDLHSYNHRRRGTGEPPDDPATNPEVNVGTGTLDRRRWAPLVERFLSDLAAFDFLGRQLDVRENVRFKGGNLSGWIHETFPRSACCLAIEVKKFFMDEWTGKLDSEEFEAVPRALSTTVPGLLESLETVGSRG
jgi:N-formylglutamate deformylase